MFDLWPIWIELNSLYEACKVQLDFFDIPHFPDHATVMQFFHLEHGEKVKSEMGRTLIKEDILLKYFYCLSYYCSEMLLWNVEL